MQVYGDIALGLGGGLTDEIKALVGGAKVNL
jgi:hypothetical protein